MKFHYEGVTKSGEKRKGVIEAESESKAQLSLREMNVYVYNLEKD